jgi:hypothetical protein
MNKFWAITSLFSPVGYRQRYANYRKFHQELNVPLLTVELAFNDSPFELCASDAEKLVQIRGGDVMWQKERLLNIAINHLPPECEYVAWLDCDVIFDDPNWVEKTQAALQKCVVVQPFQHYCELLPKEPFFHQQARSSVCVLESNALAERIFSGCGVSTELGAMPGAAWAGRREFLESNFLYDRLIMGAGDKAFLCAAYGRSSDFLKAYKLDAKVWSDYLEWGGRVQQAISGRIGYVEGSLFHLAHGDRQNKKYGTRYHGLQQFSFDPGSDIKKDLKNCWLWNSNKTAMHNHILDYFLSRDEDSSTSA